MKNNIFVKFVTKPKNIYYGPHIVQNSENNKMLNFACNIFTDC